MLDVSRITPSYRYFIFSRTKETFQKWQFAILMLYNIFICPSFDFSRSINKLSYISSDKISNSIKINNLLQKQWKNKFVIILKMKQYYSEAVRFIHLCKRTGQNTLASIPYQAMWPIMPGSRKKWKMSAIYGDILLTYSKNRQN